MKRTKQTRRGRCLGLAGILSAALLALLFVPALASAAEHPFKETFGSANQPSFTEAKSVAVDQSSGDLLVLAAGSKTVSRWKPNGEPDPFSALGTNVIDGQGGEDTVPGVEEIIGFYTGGGELEIAVDNSEGIAKGDIYVTDGSNARVDIFASTGAYLGSLTESTEGPFVEADGVAVDPSGAVYVGDTFGGAVHKFVPSANPVSNSDSNANFTSVAEPATIAAGAGPSAGYIIVHSWGSGVTKVDSSTGEAKYELELPGSGEVVATDASTGHVYASSGDQLLEFDVSGESSATQVSDTHAAAPIEGIAVNDSSGDLYLTVAGNEKVQVYGPIYPLTIKFEEGSGTVQSNPAGLTCTGSQPEECTDSLASGSVTLTASPASGYLFKSWRGCETVNGRQCTITLSAAKTVGVKFVKAWRLDATKSDPNGIFNTSPGGVNCGYGCNSSSALYKEVSLTAKTKPAKHFHFVEFTGGSGSAASCTGVTAETCTFTLSENSALEEVYAPDAKHVLSLTKEGGGQGFVKTKPTSLNCGYTCLAAEGEFFFNETAVPVKVKLNKGTTKVTWTTGAGTCTGTSEALESECTVDMSADHTLVAKFE